MGNLFSFLLNIGQLKTLPRKGWVLRGIANPESVADHSCRVAMMAWCFSQNTSLDSSRCVELALFHDVAESMIGDITPKDNIPEEEKLKKETSIFQDFAKIIEQPRLLELWYEYRDEKTPESILVHEVDKLEMLLQAYEYQEKSGNALSLLEFWTSTKSRWHNPQLQAFYDELYSKSFGMLYAWFEKKWGIRPNNLTYYQVALTLEKYETYEYLGDALLYFIITKVLVERFPNKTPGWLTNTRTVLINNKNLHAIAQELQLSDFVQYPTRQHHLGVKTLSDIIESLIAAIYLDLGLESAAHAVSVIFHLNELEDEIQLINIDENDVLTKLWIEKQLPRAAYQYCISHTSEEYEVKSNLTLDALRFQGVSKGHTWREARKDCDKKLWQWLQNQQSKVVQWCKDHPVDNFVVTSPNNNITDDPQSNITLSSLFPVELKSSSVVVPAKNSPLSSDETIANSISTICAETQKIQSLQEQILQKTTNDLNEEIFLEKQCIDLNDNEPNNNKKESEKKSTDSAKLDNMQNAISSTKQALQEVATKVLSSPQNLLNIFHTFLQNQKSPLPKYEFVKLHDKDMLKVTFLWNQKAYIWLTALRPNELKDTDKAKVRVVLRIFQWIQEQHGTKTTQKEAVENKTEQTKISENKQTQKEATLETKTSENKQAQKELENSFTTGTVITSSDNYLLQLQHDLQENQLPFPTYRMKRSGANIIVEINCAWGHKQGKGKTSKDAVNQAALAILQEHKNKQNMSKSNISDEEPPVHILEEIEPVHLTKSMNEQVNLIEKSENPSLINHDPVYLISEPKPQNLVIKKQENDARQLVSEEKDTITISTTLPSSKLANNLTENLHLKSHILTTIHPKKLSHSVTEIKEQENKLNALAVVAENNLVLKETKDNLEETEKESNVEDKEKNITEESENDASKNGRNLLHAFLQKQKVDIPTYKIIQPGPNFIVSASCTIGHHVYKEQGKGKTSREAKNNVAMLLYKKIQESSKVETSQQTKGLSLNKSLSKLHGLLQENKLPLPTYTLIKTSPIACYEATCTWNNQIYTAQGEDSSQKDAKRKAALNLLQKILQNSDNK